RHAALAFGVAGAPAAVVAAMALAAAPSAAIADWSYSFVRLGGAGGGGPAGPAVTTARWLVNYLHLLRAEWWLPLGVAGLLCIRPLQARRRALLLAGLMAVPIFALRELEPFFRTGLPLLVPLAWGIGALLDRGTD